LQFLLGLRVEVPAGERISVRYKDVPLSEGGIYLVNCVNGESLEEGPYDFTWSETTYVIRLGELGMEVWAFSNDGEGVVMPPI
jgi:hypothetical protein